MFWKKRLPLNQPKKEFRERGPRVLVVISTHSDIEKECYDSVMAQDYPDFNVMVHALPPRFKKGDMVVDYTIETIRNRNIARQMALASDAHFFLLVDSDVVLPADTIKNLMLHKKHFIAGWYPVKHYLSKKNWPAALIIEGVMHYYEDPQPSLVLADSTGMGCALVSRALYERVQWNDGTDHIMPCSYGFNVMFDDSTQFCVDAIEAGFPLYMNGDVICKHLLREGTVDRPRA